MIIIIMENCSFYDCYFKHVYECHFEDNTCEITCEKYQKLLNQYSNILHKTINHMKKFIHMKNNCSYGYDCKYLHVYFNHGNDCRFCNCYIEKHFILPDNINKHINEFNHHENQCKFETDTRECRYEHIDIFHREPKTCVYDNCKYIININIMNNNMSEIVNSHKHKFKHKFENPGVRKHVCEYYKNNIKCQVLSRTKFCNKHDNMVLGTDLPKITNNTLNKLNKPIQYYTGEHCPWIIGEGLVCGIKTNIDAPYCSKHHKAKLWRDIQNLKINMR